MAPKRSLTIEFLGEAKTDRATRDVADGLDKVSKSVKDNEAALKRQAEQSERTSDALRGVNERIGKGGADMRAYTSDLDGVGDGFNDVEDRAMGAGNIIGGVSDLMNPTGPQDYAMGLSDLAAGIRYTVVPTFQDFARGITSTMDGIKSAGGVTALLKNNMGTLAAGVGAVGVAVAAGTILWGEYQETQEKNKKRVQELSEAFKAEAKGHQGAVEAATAEMLARGKVGESLRRVDADYRVLAEGMRDNARAAEELENNQNLILNNDKTVAQVMREAGIETSAYTEELARLMESEELSTGQKRDLIDALDGESDRLQEAAQEQAVYAAATEDSALSNDKLAESIRGVNDSLRAQTDPAFALITAMDGLSDAQRGVAEAETAVNDAAAEFGVGSVEHQEALRALEDAHLGVAAASVDQETAALALVESMAAEGYSIDDIKTRMSTLATQNGWTAETIQTVNNKLNALPGQVGVTLTAYDFISSTLESVRSDINRFPREIVVNIRAQADANRFRATSDMYRAEGGPVEAGQPYIVGELGPELFVPGDSGSILTAEDTAAALAPSAGGGGGRSGGDTYYVTHVHGSVLSERDIIRAINRQGSMGNKIAASAVR